MEGTGSWCRNLLGLAQAPNHDLTPRSSFKKFNLTNIIPGLGLTKHKSVDVRAKVMNELRIIEEEGGSESDSEILIQIDFINTDHPKLRNPDLGVIEEK